jgi:hypothetical protein
MLSIFIVIFWSLFWRCGNVIASRGYDFLTGSLEKTFHYPKSLGSYKYTKKTSKKMLDFFPCGIDPNVYGMLWFIQCWFVRWTIWEFFFGHLWHLLERITHDFCFWTKIFTILEFFFLTLTKLLTTTLLPFGLTYFNSMLALLAI